MKNLLSFFPFIEKFLVSLCLLLILFTGKTMCADSLLVRYPIENSFADDITGSSAVSVQGAELAKNRFGIPKSAYFLDGKNDFITIPDFFQNVTNEFSISFWFQSLNYSPNEIFRIGDSSNFISFKMCSQRYCLVYVNDEIYYLTGTNYLNSDWHNVIVSRKDSMFIIYCDGLKIDTKYTYHATIAPSSGMVLGKGLNEDHHFRGSIDEIALYNKVFTTSEAADIYYKNNLWINGLTTDAFPAASNKEITWVSSDSIELVKLEFNSGNDVWELIADSVTASAGTYTWQTPDIHSDDCRIRITALGNAALTRTTEIFSLVKYQWKLSSPELSFSPRDGAGALHFKDKMWLLGGWNPLIPDKYPKATTNEVWTSTNGSEWDLLTKAPWEERHYAGWLVHEDKMWVIGGDNNQGHYQNDAWSSEDGINWELANASLPWGNRVTHGVFSFQGKMWMMGGQEISQFGQAGDQVYNDVWNSTDGKTWTKVLDHAPWAPRGQMGAGVVFQNKMWIIGGGTYNGNRKYYNDVWSSSDGINWTLETDNAEWRARQYHDIIVFDNKLWIIGGTVDPQNLKDVWYSEDGKHWKEFKETPWPARHASSVFNYNGSVWVLAGNLWNDSWELVNRNPAPAIQAAPDSIERNDATFKAALSEIKDIYMTVYPNPTHNKVTIAFSDPKASGFTLTIIDKYGIPVYNKQLDSVLEDTVDFSGYAKGIYSAVIVSGNEIYNKKILLQ